MSHSCPVCYLTCYCGGDIDDCCFNGAKEQINCTHCPDDYDYDDAEDDED